MLFYQLHEMGRAWMKPWTLLADANAKAFTADSTWLSSMPGSEQLSAANELLYRVGKDYEKPAFDIHAVENDDNDRTYPVVQLDALVKPFCKLLRFKRYTDDPAHLEVIKAQPTVLVVAPLSGHHSTLLRDTKVYVTDWIDARMVPADAGAFSLDDYVAYIEDFIRHIGADNLHVVSVCQPTVPVLAAVSLMAARGEPTPRSLVMMGGPIDTRQSPTAVNNLATEKPLTWFEQNVIHPVPMNYPGHGRPVYPGFLQHMGFMAMNPERHLESHWDFYRDLVKGDDDDAESHRRFYNEYNAVLDMPAEYYLDTIRIVFQEHLLPRGKWDVAGERVDPSKITGTALLTIEGELDDISGEGQTEAAHTLCTGVAKTKRAHITIKGAGHFGIFSGSRWRNQVYPQVRDFIAAHAQDASPATTKPAAKTARNKTAKRATKKTT